jgi:hypothetical protein
MAIGVYVLQKQATTVTAESGTTETTLKITDHGMSTGEMIINNTRNAIADPASRIVTVTDANTLTLNKRIVGQTSGDTIKLYKYTDYSNKLRDRTLRINPQISRRNGCSLTLIFDPEETMPSSGQVLKITSDGTTIFSGSIKIGRMRRVGTYSNPKIQMDISSIGFNEIPFRRTITIDKINQTSGDIVQFLIDNYLFQEGITAGTIITGYTWDEYPVDFPSNCISIGQILDDMAEASSAKWYIDFDKALQFISDDAGSASSVEISDDESATFTDFFDVELAGNLVNYTNKVFVRGSTDDFGDTIVVFRENATEIASRQDIEGGSGVYGHIIDTDIDATTEKTAEGGTTTTNIKITGHGLSAGDMIVNTSRNNAKRAVTAVVDVDNVTVDTVSGQVSGDTILYYPDADNKAQEVLETYGYADPKKLTFSTTSFDTFSIGEKLTVNLSTFSMTTDEYFLIESVEIKDEDGVNLFATITATSRDNTNFSAKHTKDFYDGFKVLMGKNKKTKSGGNVNLHIGPNPPNNPRAYETAWIDTDDYSEYKITTISSDATLVKEDAGIIEVSGATTVTLLTTLTSNTDDKVLYYIKNVDASNNTTVAGTIDGVTNKTLTPNSCLRVYWNGTAWRILSLYVP